MAEPIQQLEPAGLHSEMEKASLLYVVDADSTDTRMREMLSAEISIDLQIDEVYDFQTADNNLAAREYDLVFIDLDHTRHSVFAVLSELLETRVDQAVIILGTSDWQLDGVQAIQMGAQDFIEKDKVSTLAVERIVRYTIERQKASRALAKSEQLLKQKSVLLETTLENIDQGISLFDDNLDLVVANRRLFELLDVPMELMAENVNLQALFRYNAERGEYGDGDVEQQVRERLELARQFKAHRFDRVRPDGSIIEIHGAPCPDGGFVTTYTDVTSNRRIADALAESEERSRLLLESASEAIISVDQSGVIKFANPAASQLFGLNNDQLVDQQLYEIVIMATQPEGAASASLQDFYLTIGDGQPRHCRRESLRLNDGTQLEIEYVCTPVQKNGTVLGAMITIRDITERTRMLEDLRLSATVFESKDGIVIADVNGVILRTNKAISDITGYSADEAIGKPLAMIYSDRNDQDFYDYIWNQIIGLGFWEGELWNRRRDGEDYPVLLTATALQNDTGEVTHAVIHCKDISERKSMEQQLLQAQKLESIGQLAAGIAHEINTPSQYVGDNIRFIHEAFDDLMPVLELSKSISVLEPSAITAELLSKLKASLEDSDVEYLLEEVPVAIEQASEGMTRISKIVLAMKEFSHPGQEEKHAVDLNGIIRNTVTVSKNEWKYVADVEVQLQDDLPTVLGLGAELGQVILNLIVNAAHAIESQLQSSGEEKGQIQVSTSSDGARVKLMLSDSGTGIPNDIKKRVFDPFFTTKEVGKGTGQGLSIVRSVIVDKHGGDIEVMDNEPRGTTFVITLPASCPDE